MKLRKLFVLTALLSVTILWAADTKVIAHRGHWKPDGSAQNSIRSLVKADSIGCYASEFDVWMTLDSVLVVNHDPTINGIVIETTPSEVVLAQKLSNGETVPTLEAYLATAAGLPNLRLVCELKAHNSSSNEKAALKRILDLVEKYNLGDRVDYITFSKNGFKNFINMAPKGTPAYYLTGDYVPQQIKFMNGAGIDYPISAVKKHPEWIQECHDLGLLVNIWTVDNADDMQWCIDNNADFITTNEPEKLQNLLKK